MDHVYSKLKNATGFYEMVERVGDLDWLYGCVQNEDMLFVLTNTSSRVSVRDIVSRFWDEGMRVDNVHRIVSEQFGYAFTLI